MADVYRWCMNALPDAIEVIRPCVIQILADVGGRRPLVIGTGFIVDESGLALTARHVTSGLVGAGGGRVPLFAGIALKNTENMRANFQLVACEVLQEDARHDLSLIRLVKNPFGLASGMVIDGVPLPLDVAVASRSSDRPRDGVSIAVSGYPLHEPVLITTSGTLASAWAMDIAEVQLPGRSAGISIPDLKDSYVADVAANPGNSGGPVYLADSGVVIGVCVAFKRGEVGGGSPFAYNSGLTVVVPIKYGEELLMRHVH